MMIDGIGIIGTGAIAEAIVDGIRAAHGDRPTIVLSPRNAQTASSLARRHPNVHVGDDNQAVVDAMPAIILAVRPDAVHEVLEELRMPAGSVLISAVAGWSIEALREHVDAEVEIVRTIPMPAVRDLHGVTAVYPMHPVAEDLFGPLGGTLVASSPHDFDVLSAATASISTYLHYVNAIASWVAQQGIDPDQADEYVRSLFAGVDGLLADRRIPLSELGKGHETPRGNNEALRARWFNDLNKAALAESLDGIRQRVSGGRLGR